jgi:hypothetical protein
MVGEFVGDVENFVAEASRRRPADAPETPRLAGMVNRLPMVM